MRNWKTCLSVLLATSRRLPRRSRIRLALCGIVMLTMTTGASALTIKTPPGHVQQASDLQLVIPADTITPPATAPTVVSNTEPVVTPTTAAIMVPAATPTVAAVIVPAATPTAATVIVPAVTPTAAIIVPATPPADTSVTISTDDPPTTTARSDDDDDDKLCHFPQMSISFTFAQKVIASARRVR